MLNIANYLMDVEKVIQFRISHSLVGFVQSDTNLKALIARGASLFVFLMIYFHPQLWLFLIWILNSNLRSDVIIRKDIMKVKVWKYLNRENNGHDPSTN